VRNVRVRVGGADDFNADVYHFASPPPPPPPPASASSSRVSRTSAPRPHAAWIRRRSPVGRDDGGGGGAGHARLSSPREDRKRPAPPRTCPGYVKRRPPSSPPLLPAGAAAFPVARPLKTRCYGIGRLYLAAGSTEGSSATRIAVSIGSRETLHRAVLDLAERVFSWHAQGPHLRRRRQRP
jgi:hypothetical protein